MPTVHNLHTCKKYSQLEGWKSIAYSAVSHGLYSMKLKGIGMGWDEVTSSLN